LTRQGCTLLLIEQSNQGAKAVLIGALQGLDNQFPE
jgi:hypothetical protein